MPWLFENTNNIWHLIGVMNNPEGENDIRHNRIVYIETALELENLRAINTFPRLERWWRQQFLIHLQTTRCGVSPKDTPFLRGSYLLYASWGAGSGEKFLTASRDEAKPSMLGVFSCDIQFTGRQHPAPDVFSNTETEQKSYMRI